MMDRIVSGLSESSIKVRLAAVRYEIFLFVTYFPYLLFLIHKIRWGHTTGTELSRWHFQHSLSVNVEFVTDECCKSFEIVVKMFYCK